MSQARRFEEITMTESERAAFLERMRSSATPEDYQKIEGMSYDEMAAATGERIPTLKMRVHRAREALLEALKEYQ